MPKMALVKANRRGMEPNQLYFERGPDGHFFRLWYRDSGRNQLVQQRLNNYTH